jgi:phospholipid transport system substrate-binding protein
LKIYVSALAFALATAAIATAPVAAQSSAVAATPAQQKVAADFITKLAGDAFAVLRDKSLSKDAARNRFRDLLRTNFAVDETGLRLIRRYRAPGSPIKLTPKQIDAYRAALPTFLVNTYSDRLYDFAAAKVTVVRTVPRGSRGDVDVYTRITDPKGGKPIDAIWQVKAGARPLVQNITVNGVNVALTQEADFSAYIEKNGFDALVDFMKKAK